jgi:rhodanese-related sulfurtransferase
MQAGYDDVQALAGGFDAWVGAGGPVERKTG